MHAKTTISTRAGGQTGIAPLVISASRATDLPAFHADWFMDRLRRGYCVWVNPFNRKQKLLVSFEKCRLIVFWSKDPAPIIPHLDEIAARGISFYFQFTLNDYVGEGLEPHVPSLPQRIETFRRLSEKIGRDRVLWRFDPVLTADAPPQEEILRRIDALGRQLSAHTTKLVFSFADIKAYARVAANLARACPSAREAAPEERLRFARQLAALNENWQHRLALATCAEPDDFRPLGIEKNRCIDGELISKLCRGDEEVLREYGARPEQPSPAGGKTVRRKDKGQRAACGCAPSKDIGFYSSCRHYCAYCYAGHAPQSMIPA
jgi:DNA repair photolyase